MDKLGGLVVDAAEHLDRGCDRGTARALLGELGFNSAIARTGVPAPM